MNKKILDAVNLAAPATWAASVMPSVLAGAFDKDDDHELTLSDKGRYLLVAMMRQFFIWVNSVRDKARQEAGINLVQTV